MDLIDYNYLPPPNILAAPKQQFNTQIDPIEISSDEEEEEEIDNGQPESSRRTTNSESNTKRFVEVDRENAFNTQLDHFHHSLEPARKKRRKSSYSESEAEPDFDPWFNGDQYVQFAPHHVPQTNSTSTPADSNLSRAEPDTSDNLQHSNRHDMNSLSRSEAPYSNDKISAHAVKLRQAEKEHLRSQMTMEKEKTKLIAPPYYHDQKFEIRMYCGPGYELFPIALGTVPEHLAICDKWDQQQIKKKALPEVGQDTAQGQSSRTGNETRNTNDHNSPRTTLSDSDMDDIELDCLCRIREVFPRIQYDFALEKIRDNIEIERDIRIQPDASVIVSQILELETYPKQPPRTLSAIEPAADGTGVTIKWQKGDLESRSYQKNAIRLLAGHFEYIPTHFISDTLLDKKSLFDTFGVLHNIEGDEASRKQSYKRLARPRTKLEKKYINTDENPKQQWEELVNELQAAKQQIERDLRARISAMENEAFETANLEEHKANGTLVVCECCFDEEIPINRAIPCEDKATHWFCFDCVRRLAENQVGSMKHEMKCMHQDGCQAKFSMNGINLAVPTKLVDKLAFFQQQFEITSACIENLVQCPFCDFKAICDPIEENTVFGCQNPDCERVTCRICHEDSHLPKTCEEAKVDRRISARHRVEEARSKAMIRSCPKCSAKFIKEVGCNKLRCTCGTVMCYVCKMDISSRKDGGYGHFGQNPANKGEDKCALYDMDFDRHGAEVAEAEKEAIKKVQADNADMDEKQLQIETGKAAKKESRPRRDELGLGWARFEDAFGPRYQPRPAAGDDAAAQAARGPIMFGEMARRAARVRDARPVRVPYPPNVPHMPDFALAAPADMERMQNELRRQQQQQMQNMQRTVGGPFENRYAFLVDRLNGEEPQGYPQADTTAHTTAGQQAPVRAPVINQRPHFGPAGPIGMQHQFQLPGYQTLNMVGGRNPNVELHTPPRAGVAPSRHADDFQPRLFEPIRNTVDAAALFDGHLGLYRNMQFEPNLNVPGNTRGPPDFRPMAGPQRANDGLPAGPFPANVHDNPAPHQQTFQFW